MENLKKLGIMPKKNIPASLLLDTKGPEIRIKDFENGKVELKSGDTFILTSEDVLGTDEKVSVTYEKLHEEVFIGTKILIDDGLIEMEVMDITDTDIIWTPVTCL